MKTRKTIEIELTGKRERLELYLKREAEMLSGGVQSYGIGSRNLSRYNTDLAAIRAAIKELEDDIAASRPCSTGSAPAKLWASSRVTGERSPERGFFHRLTPGVFAPFLPAPAIFT